jgi:hypothetical protein
MDEPLYLHIKFFYKLTPLAINRVESDAKLLLAKLLQSACKIFIFFNQEEVLFKNLKINLVC